MAIFSLVRYFPFPPNKTGEECKPVEVIITGVTGQRLQWREVVSGEEHNECFGKHSSPMLRKVRVNEDRLVFDKYTTWYSDGTYTVYFTNKSSKVRELVADR